MAKKNPPLSRRQKWRIEKIQQERLKRQSKKDADLIEDDQEKSQAGLVIAHYGSVIVVEDNKGDFIKCGFRSNLGKIIAGDEVLWIPSIEPNTGIVTAVQDRKTLLFQYDMHGQQKPIAANLDQMMIVVAPVPGVHTNLIDRYLVAAENFGLEATIVINKADLITEEMEPYLGEIYQLYRSLGYDVLLTDTQTEDSLDFLKEALKRKRTVFVGQSGVGKSSIIQALLPDQEIRTGEISKASGLGRHTTTATTLYHFASGGDLVDSPGIRELNLNGFSKDMIWRGFVELNRLERICKFRNCTHTNEPDCGVLDAVETDEVALSRYDNYQQIILSLTPEQAY